MSAPMQVQVCRNHSGESWGFRLQGGSDFREELSVKKVSPNTPASTAGLRQGDAITAIGQYETSNMTHAQASQLIKNSGSVLVLTLQKAMCYPRCQTAICNCRAPSICGCIESTKGGSLNTLRPKGPLKFSMSSANAMAPPVNRDAYKRF